MTLDSSTDKIKLAVRNFASELEREKTSQRTREHLELKARDGLQVGGRVYGYDNHEVREGARRLRVEYRINPQQAEIVREIFRRYADGEGLRTITKDLNARRVPSPTVGRRGSGSWAPSGIWPMLRRERYLGRLVWGRAGKECRGGTRVRGGASGVRSRDRERADLRIVSAEAWDAVQARIRKVKHLRGPRDGKGRPPRYLLSGLALCGRCGGAMRVTNGRDGSRPTKVYVCGWHKDRGDTVCDNSVRRQVEDVDGLVLGWIHDQVLHEEMVVSVLREVRRRLAERAKVIDTEAPELKEKIRKLKSEISNLTTAIAGGGASPAALVQAIREREESLSVLDGRLRGLRTAPDIIGLETRRMEKEARERLANFQQLLGSSPAEAKRVLEALLDKPLVFTPTPDNNYVIEGPVCLGALLPKSSDPSGSRSNLRLAVPVEVVAASY